MFSEQNFLRAYLISPFELHAPLITHSLNFGSKYYLARSENQEVSGPVIFSLYFHSSSLQNQIYFPFVEHQADFSKARDRHTPVLAFVK
jgi:hypothetical protein